YETPHDRPGHDRPGQDRPGQDRPGQDRPGTADSSAAAPTERLDPYTPADAPGPARPWSPAWEDRDRFGYPASFYGPSGGSASSAGPTAQPGTADPAVQASAAPTGPPPTAPIAAHPGSPRRRGPGWGGVTGLVAVGMLVSS